MPSLGPQVANQWSELDQDVIGDNAADKGSLLGIYPPLTDFCHKELDF